MSQSITVTGLIENLIDDKQLHIPQGAKLLVEVPTPKKPTDKPPFSMVGNGEKNRMYQAYPLINTLLDLSKPEAWFMKMVFKHLNNSTNTSRIPYDTLSETEKRVANKAYTLLKQKELVRKVKLHTYMINPTALITNNFAEHIEAWKALDKPKKSKTVEYSKVYVYPKHFWVLGYRSWDIKKLAYIV